MKIKINKQDAVIVGALIMLLCLMAMVATISSRYSDNKSKVNQDYSADIPANHTLYVNYKSKSKDKVRIRYKSIVSYEVAESIEIPADWPMEEPLFTLSTKGNVISEAFLTADKIPIIPDVSNAFYLDDGEMTDMLFEMKINESAKEFQDKIRFEVKVIIEELTEGKWSPVYQVILMERGPYWSLDKGPIEIIMP